MRRPPLTNSRADKHTRARTHTHTGARLIANYFPRYDRGNGILAATFCNSGIGIGFRTTAALALHRSSHLSALVLAARVVAVASATAALAQLATALADGLAPGAVAFAVIVAWNAYQIACTLHNAVQQDTCDKRLAWVYMECFAVAFPAALVTRALPLPRAAAITCQVCATVAVGVLGPSLVLLQSAVWRGLDLDDHMYAATSSALYRKRFSAKFSETGQSGRFSTTAAWWAAAAAVMTVVLVFMIVVGLRVEPQLAIVCGTIAGLGAVAALFTAASARLGDGCGCMNHRVQLLGTAGVLWLGAACLSFALSQIVALEDPVSLTLVMISTGLLGSLSVLAAARTVGVSGRYRRGPVRASQAVRPPPPPPPVPPATPEKSAECDAMAKGFAGNPDRRVQSVRFATVLPPGPPPGQPTGRGVPQQSECGVCIV